MKKTAQDAAAEELKQVEVVENIDNMLHRLCHSKENLRRAYERRIYNA